MIKNNKIIKAFLFVWLIFPITSYGDYLRLYPRSPKRSLVFLNTENQLYYSQFNFLENGQYDYLNENKSFIAFLNYNLELTYQPYSWVKLTPHIQAKTYYNALSSQINSILMIPFYPTNLGGALSFPVKLGITAFQVTAKMSFPLDNQNGQIQRIILSDEAINLSLEALFQAYIQKRFIPFVRGRILYRGRELLSLIQGQIGLKYRDPVWEFGLLVGAQDSVIPINATPPVSKVSLVKKFNSGSLKFYSVDPLSIGISPWVDLKLNPAVHLFLQYGYDIYGKNYGKGHQITFGARLRLSKKMKKKSFNKNINKFQENTQNIESLLNDEGDQELMREIEKLQ